MFFIWVWNSRIFASQCGDWARHPLMILRSCSSARVIIFPWVFQFQHWECPISFIQETLCYMPVSIWSLLQFLCSHKSFQLYQELQPSHWSILDCSCSHGSGEMCLRIISHHILSQTDLGMLGMHHPQSSLFVGWVSPSDGSLWNWSQVCSLLLWYF